MKILSFDTATMETTCAVVEDGKVLATSSINSRLSHSETLIAMIEAMLTSLSLRMKDLDMIAVGVGPGSFTGLRISVVLAKIFAKTLDIPVVGVSTLSALARQVAESGVVVPVFDARRKRVYTAQFKKEGDVLTRLTKDDAIPVEELIDSLPERAIIIGAGLSAYGERFKASDKNLFCYPLSLSQVRAAFIAEEALVQYEKDGASNPYELEPNYLRPSQAMREYRRKHGQSHDA
nr:tRNA (adenosine(37)-N6)-threonylcarbamoyltransferase complex dimerization subunit type 1 TsaB [uncultured Peptoniphilus sp.]